MDHIAEHALADVLGVDLRPAYRFLDDARGELARRDVFEAAESPIAVRTPLRMTTSL
jgi:hypothetical protein